MDNNSLAHTKWNCVFHIVFIPKYRLKTMYEPLKAEIKDIIKQLCEMKHVEIVECAVCVDHVHLCVKIPPMLSASDYMGYLKGKSALMIFDRNPQFRKKGCDRPFGREVIQ